MPNCLRPDTRLTGFAMLIAIMFAIGASCLAQERLKQLDTKGDQAISEAEAGARIWRRIKQYDTNEDGRVTVDEFRAARAARGAAGNRNRAASGPRGGYEIAPTFADLRYSDKYERATLDLWLPAPPATEGGEGAGEGLNVKPRPIVVYFHGGGFRAGNKSAIWFEKQFIALTEKGMAFATVGYPLTGDAEFKQQGLASERAIISILQQATKAIAYLRANADKYHLDGEQIIVAGNSAGCVIAEYLAYAEPVGAVACIGIQRPHRTEWLTRLVKADSPPLVLYTNSGPSDSVHHPDHAKLMKTRCDELGVPCFMFGSEKSGLPTLPEGTALVTHALSLIEHARTR